jgi:hypothetical protein
MSDKHFYLIEHDKILNTDTILYSSLDKDQVKFMLDLLKRYADEDNYTFHLSTHSHTVTKDTRK